MYITKVMINKDRLACYVWYEKPNVCSAVWRAEQWAGSETSPAPATPTQSRAGRAQRQGRSVEVVTASCHTSRLWNTMGVFKYTFSHSLQ